jgi:predicted deacetylase
MSEKLQVPDFRTESEEAEWWFANREENGERFATAIREGRASRNTLEQRVAESLSVHLDPADGETARQLAASSGIEYKSFV